MRRWSYGDSEQTLTLRYVTLASPITRRGQISFGGFGAILGLEVRGVGTGNAVRPRYVVWPMHGKPKQSGLESLDLDVTSGFESTKLLAVVEYARAHRR